jgi:hypothetical protein
VRHVMPLQREPEGVSSADASGQGVRCVAVCMAIWRKASEYKYLCILQVRLEVLHVWVPAARTSQVRKGVHVSCMTHEAGPTSQHMLWKGLRTACWRGCHR